MKKISVIILSYKQESFIEKAIRGVFMQKGNLSIELIISDDSSPDNTQKVISKVIESAPENIKIIYTPHQKNLGATANFFDAITKVTGEYLCFCEGDDYWTDENKLQIQYDFLENNSDYSMCFHQVINVSPDSEIDGTVFSKVENNDYTMLEIYQHWLVHTTSVFMRTDVLKNKAVQKLVSHPELLYFDTFLYMACGLNGKIRGMNLLMSAYRRHEAGISNGINYKRDLRHNHLDQVIAETFDGKMKESANWQIFSRSRAAFNETIKKGKLLLAIKHLIWILKKKGNLRVYLTHKLKG